MDSEARYRYTRVQTSELTPWDVGSHAEQSVFPGAGARAQPWGAVFSRSTCQQQGASIVTSSGTICGEGGPGRVGIGLVKVAHLGILKKTEELGAPLVGTMANVRIQREPLAAQNAGEETSAWRCAAVKDRCGPLHNKCIAHSATNME